MKNDKYAFIFLMILLLMVVSSCKEKQVPKEYAFKDLMSEDINVESDLDIIVSSGGDTKLEKNTQERVDAVKNIKVTGQLISYKKYKSITKKSLIDDTYNELKIKYELFQNRHF